MNFAKMALSTGLVVAGLVVAPLQAQVKVFAGTEDRQLTRLFYYSDAGGAFQPAGQVSIDFGAPVWKKEYDGQVEAMKGKVTRWRFGSGAWTTLDTNVDLTFGETKVAAGQYYLVLEMDAEGAMHLVLLDPAAIRKAKLDAFQAGETKYGTRIPLQWKKVDATQEKFSIALTTAQKDATDVTLTVRWGGHQLTTKLVAHAS